MSEEQTTQQQPPLDDNAEAWKAYWEGMGMSWRLMPLSSPERQEELARLVATPFDWRNGIIPFKNVRLTRGDVEWLLATHEGNRGPIDWNDPQQRTRQGLAIQGADLRGVDLSDLPLAGLGAGLNRDDWYKANEEQRLACATLLTGANLSKTHLENADLRAANLEGAYLRNALLTNAHITGARLAGAYLAFAHLEGAYLAETHLGGRDITAEELEQLQQWIRALSTSHKWRMSIRRRGKYKLMGANFALAYFDMRTDLFGAIVGDGLRIADLRWNGTNLARVKDWEPLQRLGDEFVAREAKDLDGNVKDHKSRLDQFIESVRAYRQLTTQLREQGLNDEADRFAFRAAIMQRKVVWWRRKYVRWFGSMWLAAISGYGYRLWRIAATYAVIVSLFSAGYFAIDLVSGHNAITLQNMLNALQISLNAIHGRVFFAQFGLDTAQSWLATIESIFGIGIEGVFVAMIIQRFFSK